MAKHIRKPPIEPDQRPRLGSGVEPFEGEGIGYGDRDGPESQGRFSGEDFGMGAQGEYGDEDYDPSYARDDETDEVPVVDEGAVPARVLPSEHEGPGRGEEGTSYVAPPATEPVDLTGAGDSGPPPDDSLEEQIAERLEDDVGVDEIDVVVTVKDGVVRLDGDVDTDEMRDLTERCVTEVAGVQGVENHIRVRATEA